MELNVITSYGILLYYIDPKKVPRYLLCQRRDTVEYSDLIKGKYSNQNLEVYCQLMCREEKRRILEHSFRELWDDLWVDHTNIYYKSMYEKAEKKFLNNRESILKYINSPNASSIEKREPGWGFPKGKKNFYESEIDCAFREFKEETNMIINYLNLLNIAPIDEIFKGSNGKMYSTIYYIAAVAEEIPIIKRRLNDRIRTTTISDETSNLRWCTLEEAKNLLPEWRYEMLYKLHTRLNN